MQELPEGPLSLTARRGRDLQEVTVEAPHPASHDCNGSLHDPSHPGQQSAAAREGLRPPPLRGALVYGFRAIQNLVRKIKRGQCDYDFVEVMACPSGCLNGGGQVATEGKGQATVQAHIARLDELYHDRDDVDLEWPDEDAEAQGLVAALQSALPGGDVAAPLGAEFHVREKTAQAVVADW